MVITNGGKLQNLRIENLIPPKKIGAWNAVLVYKSNLPTKPFIPLYLVIIMEIAQPHLQYKVPYPKVEQLPYHQNEIL